MSSIQELNLILEEIERKPIGFNDYRKVAGRGRSQAFGIVGKRCLPPDYSRQCWTRPYLYKLLLDYAEAYVDIPWNAVTVNQNFQCSPHYDRNNIGDSYLVGFGDYEGGSLILHLEDGFNLEDGLEEYIDIKEQPLVLDFTKTLHSVEPFTGTRISLVYYFYDTKGIELPPPSVRLFGSEYRFFRGEQIIEPLNGLPHPLQKKES